MDVDVGGNPKKRSAEVSLEELPFAKRTKYKELFPSAFSTVRVPVPLKCPEIPSFEAFEAAKRVWNSAGISNVASDLACVPFD